MVDKRHIAVSKALSPWQIIQLDQRELLAIQDLLANTDRFLKYSNVTITNAIIIIIIGAIVIIVITIALISME